jgi:hypothetical protein
MAGNATLTTKSDAGMITTDLWLQSIQTSSDTQFDENQLKRGVSYRPIRRSEMSVDFTAIWSLQNFDQMDNFQETIRKHYIAISQGNYTPMTLLYKKNNLIYNGWIESVQKQYIRFQDFFVRSYRMNILMPQDNVTNGNSINVGFNAQGTINPNSIQYYGALGNWYNFTTTYNVSAVQTNMGRGTTSATRNFIAIGNIVK